MDRPIPDWLDVSRETLQKLEHYADEVSRWNATINLVSKSSMTGIWQRHIIDSAQIYCLASPQQRWVDLGSGGGFPGIVMAIMGAADMTLVESDQRKATFLREIARQLALPVKVLATRLEAVAPLSAETVTARALASLTDLLTHATPHLAPTARGIFPKGRGFGAEIQQARLTWSFKCTEIPSRTDPEAAILVLEEIRRL